MQPDIREKYRPDDHNASDNLCDFATWAPYYRTRRLIQERYDQLLSNQEYDQQTPRLELAEDRRYQTISSMVRALVKESMRYFRKSHDAFNKFEEGFEGFKRKMFSNKDKVIRYIGPGGLGHLDVKTRTVTLDAELADQTADEGIGVNLRI